MCPQPHEHETPVDAIEASELPLSPHTDEPTVDVAGAAGTSALPEIRIGLTRLRTLDVLRGAAILLVILHHTTVPLTGCPEAIIKLKEFGWSGVDLFFVLSGFLIGSLLFAELVHQKLRFKRFWIRRAFRIWPPYFLYVFVAFLAIQGHEGMQSAWRAVGPCLLHVQNYFVQEGLTQHLWSLAIEEQFYLALPIVLWIATRRNMQTRMPSFPVGCIILLFLFAILRSNDFAHHKLTLHRTYFTQLRGDCIVFGVMLAYLYAFKSRFLTAVAKRPDLLALVGLFIISPVYLFDPYSSQWFWSISYSLLAVGYGCIVLAFVRSETDSNGFIIRAVKTRLGGAVATIGKASYSIYLWHFFARAAPILLTIFFAPIFNSPTIGLPLQWIAFFACSLGIGMIAAHAVEFKTTALRDRILK